SASHRQLITVGTSALSDETVNNLSVFLRQLCRNGIPQHTNTWYDFMWGVLGEILLVRCEDPFLDSPDFFEVLVFRKCVDSLRHAAHIIVLAQPLGKSGRKAIDERPIFVVQQLCQRGLTYCR